MKCDTQMGPFEILKWDLRSVVLRVEQHGHKFIHLYIFYHDMIKILLYTLGTKQ